MSVHLHRFVIEGKDVYKLNFGLWVKPKGRKELVCIRGFMFNLEPFGLTLSLNLRSLVRRYSPATLNAHNEALRTSRRTDRIIGKVAKSKLPVAPRPNTERRYKLEAE